VGTISRILPGLRIQDQDCGGYLCKAVLPGLRVRSRSLVDTIPRLSPGLRAKEQGCGGYLCKAVLPGLRVRSRNLVDTIPRFSAGLRAKEQGCDGYLCSGVIGLTGISCHTHDGGDVHNPPLSLLLHYLCRSLHPCTQVGGLSLMGRQDIGRFYCENDLNLSFAGSHTQPASPPLIICLPR
jgi:hypothetical protein